MGTRCLSGGPCCRRPICDVSFCSGARGRTDGEIRGHVLGMGWRAHRVWDCGSCDAGDLECREHENNQTYTPLNVHSYFTLYSLFRRPALLALCTQPPRRCRSAARRGVSAHARQGLPRHLRCHLCVLPPLAAGPHGVRCSRTFARCCCYYSLCEDLGSQDTFLASFVTACVSSLFNYAYHTLNSSFTSPPSRVRPSARMRTGARPESFPNTQYLDEYGRSAACFWARLVDRWHLFSFALCR